jgi:ribosome biogenesis GTPase / thiamine phosphate phosphatase
VIAGWDTPWDDARRAVDPDATLEPVRVIAEHRGAYEAMGAGGTGWIELPGKAFHAAADKRDLPTVGDWVLVERWADATAAGGAAIVRAILPRRSFLVRRAAGEATAPQPLAANVDTGIVVTSANTDLSLARLDRYIGLLRDGGIEPVIVVSKLDLAGDPAAVLARAGAIGPRVIGTSTVTGEGLDAVRELVRPGQTGVLLGSSGVGKSSLLNLVAGTAQPVRDIRQDERGRHTTTRRELFAAPDGTLWIDTPGMRELARWVDEDETAFDDIAELAHGCRFRDCMHRDEPGCAVRGHVAPERLSSFHKLADERRAAATKQAAAERLGHTRRAKQARKPPKPDRG